MELPRLAVKTLSSSDLTFFAQFAQGAAVHQKSINLNIDVFIEEMYPGIRVKQSIPVRLDVHGPGTLPVLALTRKIIRSAGSKNWRLDGEVIPDPADNPTRFGGLVPGDLAFFLFTGDLAPESVTMVLVSNNTETELWTAIRQAGLSGDGQKSMIAVRDPILDGLIESTKTAYAGGAHPLLALVQDEVIQSVVLPVGPERSPDGRGPPLDQATLAKQMSAASDTGILGEQLVADHFEREKGAGRVIEYEWVSVAHARASYDFAIRLADGTGENVEVKTTKGPFEQSFYISRAEVTFAEASSVPYRIYRVSHVDSNPSLRIIRDVQAKLASLRSAVDGLPPEVTAETFAVSPALFGDVQGPYALAEDADSPQGA